MRKVQALAGALLASLVLAACVATTPPPPAERPRLVVVFVVDGLPQRQVTGYRNQLAPDGLARFLDRGAWYPNAYYGHAFTVTAAGHATLLTGAYPDRTGIIGNEWRHPETGAATYCTGDTSATYIGHKTNALDGTSPRNLLAETVGDVLRRTDGRAKVLAISGKDRGAILPAGHAGTAYMYMSQTGQFATSTYYMKEHPRWVAEFNAAKPADRYFHREWHPLLGEKDYAGSTPDDQKWYARGAGKLPMKMGEGMAAPAALFYGLLLRSPFSDALTLDFARAAIRGEGLGQDEIPDILTISLSGHDYVNHAYSAESRISHDHTLQLDRHLQAFFRDLDTLVGRDNYVAILTADHGFSPAPEYSQQMGQGGGRLSGSQTIARMNAELSKSLGEGNWVLGFSAGGVALNRKLAAERAINPAALADAARAILVGIEGVAAAYTRAELLAGTKSGSLHFDAMRKTWNADRSGDIQMALQPFWLMTSSSSATSHGSPHEYDTNVPLLFYGPRWVRPGMVAARAEIADIAPTLARILGIPVPSLSEGRVLRLD